jgi:2-phospho-L-lactate guanylyltransferase
MEWVVVVPVKPAAEGKTRLAGVLEPADRAALARAMARDTIEAAAATAGVARVLVVTSDDELRATVPSAVDDPGGGLNAAIRAGVAQASLPVAVLLGDLPALRPDDLAAALVLAEQHPRALVADADGTGTTLLTGLVAFTPRFGVDSAALHEADGHIRLDVPLVSTLRRDVDVPSDLTAVARLGVGRWTAAALARSESLSGVPVDEP